MQDILGSLYPWTKSLHVIAVIAWMAGLFYLPRLYVHHIENKARPDSVALFGMMEYKLLRFIMNPSMIATWTFGLLLVATPGVVDWSQVWPWTKAAAVLGMTWFHMWCAVHRKKLAEGRDEATGRTYRLMNEVPTLLMVIIVVSVIARPF